MFRRYCLLLIFFLAQTVLFAQTPLYGLGDPIININFEAGSSVVGPEFPGYSDYFYAAGVPSFGFYTRVNNSNINPNWWPTTDHTGGNGYMLVAKPRNGLGIQVLFQSPVNSLCSGTSYQASAYMLNLSKTPGGIPPEMTLRIVDANTQGIISEVNFGPLLQVAQTPTNSDWVRYILPFTVPAGVTNVRLLVICRTAGGANLDDFAIDDITVNATGQKIDVMFTGGNPVIKAACASLQEKFTVTATPPDPGNEIMWQRKLNDGSWEDIPNSSTNNYEIESSATPGLWSYRAASGPPGKIGRYQCNVVSNEIAILVRPEVKVSAGSDKFYLRGGAPVVLEGNSNTTDLTWTAVSGDDISSLSSINTATTLASPNQTTTYRLTAKADGVNTCGAEVFDEVTVLVADEVKLPNTFTPNGDGINDKWIIGGIESYPNPRVQVYSRNGQLVYRSVGGASPWDGTYKGKNVPAGNYYYIVDLGLNGTKLSGSVTVLR